MRCADEVDDRQSCLLFSSVINHIPGRHSRVIVRLALYVHLWTISDEIHGSATGRESDGLGFSVFNSSNGGLNIIDCTFPVNGNLALRIVTLDLRCMRNNHIYEEYDWEQKSNC